MGVPGPLPFLRVSGPESALSTAVEKGKGMHDRERAGPGPQPLDLAFEGLRLTE